MKGEYRSLYISVAVNFLVGAILGIILFYGQVKNTGETAGVVFEYNKEVTLSDFFRLSWTNIIWMLSVLFARTILPVGFFHPIVALRGIVSTFSALYILSLFGIRETVASLLPQCVSILPLISFFSVETVIKHRNNIRNGCEPCSLKRYETAGILVLAMVSAAAEVLFFALFCDYLF